MATRTILTAEQIERLRARAPSRDVKAGDVLYEPNDETPPVFVVVSGGIQIVAVGGAGDQVVATYRAGEFSGELLMVSGRRSIYRCRVLESGSLLELKAAELRALLAHDAELGQVVMDAFLARRAALTANGQGNVVVIGRRTSSHTLAVRDFLVRDGHPFAYFDLDSDPAGAALLERFGAGESDLPAVICNDHELLRAPSPRQIAEALGFNARISGVRVRDLVVVGGGPAGLAAAVYAASEGLDVLVVEKDAPGGQAASSSKIENYLGFPAGLSGRELAARAIAQAEKFGAEIMVARTATGLNCDAAPYRLRLDDGTEIPTRTIVLATGAQYNQLDIANIGAFAGRGIYYSATFMEAQLCAGEDVIVVGAGNSAGQAATFLAASASSVHIFVRAARLEDTMSRYLVDRIIHDPRIHLHLHSELTNLEGEEHLEGVRWKNRVSGERGAEPVRHVFVMTGASPKTEWLAGCVARDAKGFVVTGGDIDAARAPVPWVLPRTPLMLEASLPGVFVVGDARAGNVKRVASAVGEGSIVVHLVHQALASASAA